MIKDLGDSERTFCFRCGGRIEDHASVTIDDEQQWICPVEERAVDDDLLQEQLGAFVEDGDRS